MIIRKWSYNSNLCNFYIITIQWHILNVRSEILPCNTDLVWNTDLYGLGQSLRGLKDCALWRNKTVFMNFIILRALMSPRKTDNSEFAQRSHWRVYTKQTLTSPHKADPDESTQSGHWRAHTKRALTNSYKADNDESNKEALTRPKHGGHWRILKNRALTIVQNAGTDDSGHKNKNKKQNKTSKQKKGTVTSPPKVDLDRTTTIFNQCDSAFGTGQLISEMFLHMWASCDRTQVHPVSKKNK